MPDIYYSYNNINFIWDETKAIKVYKDHNLQFTDVVTIFDDWQRCEEVDIDPGEEERFKTIGLANIDGEPILITVVYTVKDDFIRVITAWKSTASEQERYKEV